MSAGQHALCRKAISIGDEFLPAHYARKPVMPSTLVLEAVTQVAGWLYIVSSKFAISTVLGLVEGVQILGDVRPGQVLELEAWMQYHHREGATLRGVARVDGVEILRAERLVFASRALTDPEKIEQAKELFRYLGGDPS
jgi:3-hydroxymyristoyl/3-hydroxydecanoyl-(acyl carrier protein) dehydratase